MLDAAMGTRLIAAGLDLATDDPCLWILSHPDLVRRIHAQDVAAGAGAVFTNTFGANRIWLDRFGKAGDAIAINCRAVAIARQAIGPDRFVIGSIGPTATQDQATLCDQAETLLEAGADALVLETLRFDQAITALDSLRSIRVPVLVGLFAWPDPIATTARRLADSGASILGANCFTDLAFAHHFLDEFAPLGNLIPWLKPSNGLPGSPPLNLDEFARLASRMANLPTGLLGGCCGTTASHLQVIRAAWNR